MEQAFRPPPKPSFAITPSCPPDPQFYSSRARFQRSKATNRSHTVHLATCWAIMSCFIYSIEKYNNSIPSIATSQKGLQPSYCTWGYSVLQHLYNTLVACGHTVVSSFVSKGVNQLCVGPASQQSLYSFNTVTFTSQH